MAILQIIGLSGENNSLLNQANYLCPHVVKGNVDVAKLFSLVTTERNLCNLLFAYFTFTDNVKINKIYEAS